MLLFPDGLVLYATISERVKVAFINTITYQNLILQHVLESF